MSRLVESLQSQMRAIFGDSFGQTVEPIGDLSEAIETALMEARGKGKALANKLVKKPVKKKPDAKKAKAKAKDAARKPLSAKAKKTKSVADKHRAEQEARIKKNMAAFFRHAEKEGQKSASRPRPEKLKPDASKASGGRSGTHNPFKHSPNLGTGPGTPPGFRPVHGKRHHDERKCWSCRCGNVYEKGCECVGTGATKDCPKGHIKHVQIHKDYRHAYNDMYHAWRRGEGKYANRKGKWQGPRR